MARRVSCSAKIPNQAERQAVLAWVKTIANGGYSEKEDVVFMTYTERPDDPEASSKFWGIIHYFEHFAEHEIVQTKVEGVAL